MLKYFEELANRYDSTLENVISIAINRYGIIIENFEDNRIRFDLNILNADKDTFFAVCVNTYKNSPFVLKDNKLLLAGKAIGTVKNIEKDTCTSTYFRNGKKAITFNSNSRSKCIGCKFCGTYSLSDEDTIDFSTKDNVKIYFENLLKENNIESMDKIEDITICTGCFENENALINHLLLVNAAFKEMGFKGRINYIGSQLRDYHKIKEVSEVIGNFGIYLTVEKFLDRDKYMRPEKASLTLEEASDLLTYCSTIGITTTFLYILGLEDLETIRKYFNYFKDDINKFPIIQVFQNYTSLQEQYRCEEGKSIEYYLEAKQMIKQIFDDKNLNPNLWECFRGLYSDNKNKGEKTKCLTK